MDYINYVREFTGSSISVLFHSNSTFINLEGNLVEETARTFTIDVNGSSKIVPKTTGRFKIISEKFNLMVKGDSILMRPEERLKNLRRILKNEKKGDDYN